MCGTTSDSSVDRANGASLSNEAATSKIHAYGRRIHEIRGHRGTIVQSLQDYSEVALPLVAADTRRRFEEVKRLLPETGLVKQYVPSISQVAELPLFEETRHSLVLAWLLDPQRSGGLAKPFWLALLRRLRQNLDGLHASRRELLDQWTTSWSPRLKVDPRSHGAEWLNLDVFAREKRGPRYVRGMVIENKVRPDTEEQEGQLRRYFDLVGRRFGSRGQERTLFLFLTEAPRDMKTATGASEAFWAQLQWADIADLLVEVACEPDLREAERLFALQYRDLVSYQILGSSQLDDLRRLCLALEGSMATDEGVAESQTHTRVCKLARYARRRTP